MDTMVEVGQQVSGWLQVAFQIGMLVLAWLINRLFAGYRQWTMIWIAFGLGFGSMLTSRILVLLIASGYTSAWIIFVQRYISLLVTSGFLFVGMYLLHRMLSGFPHRPPPPRHELPDPAGINMDEGSFVTAWDMYAEAMFGYAASEAVGRRLTVLVIPARYQQDHLEGVARYLRERDTRPLSAQYPVTAHDKAGIEFPVMVRINMVPQSDGRVQFAGTITRVES